MKTITTTPSINITNSNINTIYQLLQMKNLRFDVSVCKYKKTRKGFNSFVPVVTQSSSGMIYKLSYITFKHKGRVCEDLKYIPVAMSSVIFKSLV